MKKLIFLMSLALGFTAQARLVIISDIDDTLKQTDVLNKLDTVQNAIVGEKAFQWMPKIFSEIEKHHNQKATMIYVSSSLDCISKQSKWLSKHGFPKGTVYQRTCKSGEIDYQVPGRDYKILVISKELMLLPAGEEHEIYMFGDNGQHDPDIYQFIKNAYPNIKIKPYIRDIRVEATQIHPALSVKKLSGINYFLSEVDLFTAPDFFFLDPELKSKMLEDDEQNKLLADYLPLTLSKRFCKAGYRKFYGKKLAKNLIQQYY